MYVVHFMMHGPIEFKYLTPTDYCGRERVMYGIMGKLVLEQNANIGRYRRWLIY